MTAFELVEPSSLGEALGLLDPDDPAVRPIAGGTALMLMMKTGLYRPRRLVSLRALGRPLTMIAFTPEGGLDIGDGATGADRALGGRAAGRAGHRRYIADPFQCPRAQCRDRRWQSRARRSAHA